MPRVIDDDVWEGGFDDEMPTVPCPYCKREIFEDTPRCPFCEQYISREDAGATSTKPWWIIIGVGLCLYAVYKWNGG